MKVVLAFDTFKGSLTAEQAVAAARDGVLTAQPDAKVVCLPLADGGEGTAEVLCRYLQAEWIACAVHDPLLRPIEAKYAISKDGKTAIMEMASAAGLTLLADGERNPTKTSTFGVGEMMHDAMRRGCTHIIIGIGGSATNDGGTGMLAAIGVRFLSERGETLTPTGETLAQMAHIDWRGLPDLSGISIDVVCDVTNPLFGHNGAAHVYAPQKGASPEEVAQLDAGLRHLAHIAGANPDTAGCGAAGGLGYGLLLLGAHLRRGTDMVLDAADIDRHLQGADLVITGEGKTDRQTLNGKLPFGVLQRAKAHDVPVIVLAGQVEDRAELLQAGFRDVVSINPPGLPASEAMRPEVAARNLTNSTRQQLARYLQPPTPADAF